MSDDDNIRDPDNIYSDQLLSNNDINEINLDDILKQSRAEYELIENKKEQELLKELILLEQKERQEVVRQRTNKFINLKKILNRMIMIDKSNSNTFEILLSVIEMYENGYCSVYNIDTNEYNNLFNLVNKIRILPEELVLLKKIIIEN